MRRLAVCLAGACLLSMVALAAQQPAAPSDDENWKPATITNLTVLPKDMPVDEVMKVMKAWDAALNVQCVFCHVGQIGKPLSTFDFASDAKKRKEVSRAMLKAVMAANEIFKPLDDDPPQVRCSTCHKRSRHVDDDLPAQAPSDEHKQ